MPMPHDYYDPHSPEPHLHNKHNHAPYLEPDWQANAAKDQLPDISTIGRGPRGVGLYISGVKRTDTYTTWTINEDDNGEPVATIGPIPNGAMKIEGGANGTFVIKYTTVNKDGEIENKQQTINVPKGDEGGHTWGIENSETRTLQEDGVYRIPYSALNIPEDKAPKLYDAVVFNAKYSYGGQQRNCLVYGYIYEIDAASVDPRNITVMGTPVYDPPAGGAGGGGNANVENLTDFQYEELRSQGLIEVHTVYVISNESNQ